MSECWCAFKFTDGVPVCVHCKDSVNQNFAWGYNACRAVAVEKIAAKDAVIQRLVEAVSKCNEALLDYTKVIDVYGDWTGKRNDEELLELAREALAAARKEKT